MLMLIARFASASEITERKPMAYSDEFTLSEMPLQ
jgi:hypothetical protein